HTQGQGQGQGQVAYVPQQAWIQNATIQNNILFGQPMQGLKYSETLHSCALEPDLEILPGGDQTEIGEKGINLSGGQKQRVSLARAVYQEADVYLLDDPLSAVDSHVGKHIFEKVIGPEGMIRNKTRILVTHGINYLPQCDQIVVMNGGRISEIGSYGELIDADGAFAEFIRVYSGVGEEDGEDAPSVSEYTEYCEENLNLEQSDSHGALDPSVFSDDPETRSRRRAHGQHLEKKRVSKSELKRQLSRQMSSEVGEKKASAEHTDKSTLIKQEKVETGSVHMSVLFAYVRACTYPLSLLTILFYLLTNGASLASNFWLADWSNSNTPENRNQTVTACDSLNSLAQRSGCYLGVYGALGIIQSFLILFAAFSLALSAIFASRTLHNSMLKNILRSPMSFFDTTPLGRILNRFSKDTYIIDEVIPRSLRSFIFTFLSVMATLIVIVVTTPPFLVIIVPLLILYAIIQRFYVATSRQLKRLESTTRSPIYSHFQESVMGVSSIRAYRVQQRFVLQSEEQVDYNQLAYYPSICSNRWLAIRLEFMGNLIILFAALFVVIQRNYQEEIKIRINAGLVGLSISYALQVSHVSFC
ncbi:Multidrug resistance-associated protein 1, partial [Geodia barretti]